MTQLALDYSQLIPYLLLAFVTAFVATPLVGKIAVRLGALDLPAYLRSRLDRTADRRIHDRITPKLGGLAMVVAIIVTLVVNGSITDLRWGIIAGIIVIAIVGFLDDLYDLSGRMQLLGQVIAAMFVVLSGITMTSLQVANTFIDLNLWSTTIEIGNFMYQLIFPADIITVLWIVGIINAVNWVGGIDALNGSLSSIASLAMLLIAMRTGNLALALLIATHLGSVLGVLPYNYNPAKIFYGSIGDYLNGFLLAVFAILSGSKLAIAIIILGLPIIDALWVVIQRVRKNPEILRNPIMILNINDKSHFHHRLLGIGYSQKTVLFIEIAIMSILATLAFYISGFRNEFVALIGAITVLIIVFAAIALAQGHFKRLQQREAQKQAAQPKVEVKVIQSNTEEDPEKRYAY